MLSNEISKKELLNLLEFTNNALGVDDSDRFTSLINGVKTFIPFSLAICALGRLENRDYKIINMVNHSYPNEWMDLYLKQGYVTVDPIIQTHFAEFKPQIFSETYKKVKSINKNFLCRSNDFGLSDGVAFGINDFKNNLVSLFSFSGIDESPSPRHLHFLEYLVPHLHQLYMRLSKDHIIENMDNPNPKVSPREKEVLSWLQEGKTNWETSMILNISERTVKFHVSNLIEKLDAVSRGHVVAKALEYGII